MCSSTSKGKTPLKQREISAKWGFSCIKGTGNKEHMVAQQRSSHRGWGGPSTTIRNLVLRAKDRDDEAFNALIKLIRSDLDCVVGKNLSDKRLHAEVLQAVIVRLFVYLPRFRQTYLHRSTATDPIGDQRCLSDLRRWSTNLARNWTRTVNQYGVAQA